MDEVDTGEQVSSSPAVRWIMPLPVKQARNSLKCHANQAGMNRLRWFTLYILEAFLLVQNAYPLLLAKMHALAIGNEERILNAVWIGLLSVEIIMVLGVAVQSIAKRLSYRPKAKTS